MWIQTKCTHWQSVLRKKSFPPRALAAQLPQHDRCAERDAPPGEPVESPARQPALQKRQRRDADHERNRGAQEKHGGGRDLFFIPNEQDRLGWETGIIESDMK